MRRAPTHDAFDNAALPAGYVMADRKKRWRERQQQQGMMQVRVWVPEHQAELIKAVAESLRPMPIEEFVDDIPPKPSSVDQPPTAKMLEFAAELEALHGIQAPDRIKRSKLLLWLWLRRNRKAPSRLDDIQEEGRRRKVARIQQRIATLEAQLKALNGEPSEMAEPEKCYGLMFRFPVKPPAVARDHVKKMGCIYHPDQGYWTVKVMQADKEWALKELHKLGAQILLDESVPRP